MLRCTITDAAGGAALLPDVLSWDISHGFGSPCDCFEVEFPLTGETLGRLERAVLFRAECMGRTVFEGVVDEFELRAAQDGAVAALRGRGLQARLLDNEAESAQYAEVSLETLLRTYAAELGVTEIDDCGLGGVCGPLTVDSGASCWSVLSEFCRFHAGVSPRFSPGGVLVADGVCGGQTRVVGPNTPVTSMSYREDRFGVISEVIVKNKARGTRTEVFSSDLAEKGLSCRRVVSVPRRTGYDAMRHTGAYQLARSREELFTATLAVPWLFAAFPGDILRVDSSPLGVTGEFLVRESRCRADGDGAQTVLTLARR